MSNVLRLPAEQLYAKELEALKEEDKKQEKPIGWQLSPKAVLKFVTGGTRGFPKTLQLPFAATQAK